MGNRDYGNTPRHGGKHAASGSAANRSGSRSRSGKGETAYRPRREALRDNYYYEEPPRGWKEGDQFQDISSYSSPAKRRADQRAMEEEVRNTRRRSSRAQQDDGRDI